MAPVRRAIAWWRSLPLPWRRWRVIARVGAGDEIPDRLPHNGAVLVGPPGCATWVVFDCPCRRGHRLIVNLNKSRCPFWSIYSLKPLSIRPSIDDITPQRRCHFVLRNGRIRWAARDRKGAK